VKARNLHRIVGLVLLLPLIGWVVTGFIFFVKPGYAGAYASLRPKTYPMREAVTVSPDSAWMEFRCVRTVLGDHLLVRGPDGWSQLDPVTLLPRPRPGGGEIGALVADAIGTDPDRYGTVATVAGDSVTTTTHVVITVDWGSLGLYQRGEDTDLIDTIYRIHYLQWTGIETLDRVLGGAGLVLLALLSLLGLRLAFRR